MCVLVMQEGEVESVTNDNESVTNDNESVTNDNESVTNDNESLIACDPVGYLIYRPAAKELIGRMEMCLMYAFVCV